MISAKKPAIKENTNNASTSKQNGRADPCPSPIMNS